MARGFADNGRPGHPHRALALRLAIRKLLCNTGTDAAQLAHEVLVSARDMFNTGDPTFAVGGQRGQDKRRPRPQVGDLYFAAVERARTVENSSVRIEHVDA